jgi:uncharacterized membrane protein YqjE
MKVRRCPGRECFRSLEIATIAVLALALVLLTLRPDAYPLGFAVFMLVALSVAVWLLDRARRRR